MKNKKKSKPKLKLNNRSQLHKVLKSNQNQKTPKNNKRKK